MKHVLFAFCVIFSSAFAHADQVDWQGELAQFKQGLAADSTAHVWADAIFYIGESTVTCTADTLITGAVAISETAPVLNGAVQIVSTYPNFDQDLSKIFTWNAAANTTRGAVGGGVVAVTDTLQFVYLWLGGNQAQSYQELAKAYSSTIASADALFANQGTCMMSIAKVALAGAEIQARSNPVQTPDQAPAQDAPAPLR